MGSPVVPCNDPLKEGGVLGAVSTIPYRNFLSIFTPHLTATAAFWEHLHHLRWNSRSGSGEWEPTLQKQLANVVSQMLRVTTPQPIIFRGYVSYDPYFWGLKLSFFMYHSHGSYGYAKNKDYAGWRVYSIGKKTRWQTAKKKSEMHFGIKVHTSKLFLKILLPQARLQTSQFRFRKWILVDLAVVCCVFFLTRHTRW